MRLQRTIKREAMFSGIGLHTGRYATVKLRPAPRDSGIIFYRSDRGVIIKANIASVSDTAFATTLGFNGVKVRTVEHLLSAAAGLGIDNLIVEVNGPEIPILDGSSTDLVGIILEAGIAKQGRKSPYIKITGPVVYEDAHSMIAAIPHNGFRISYSIKFDHPLLRHQELTVDVNEENFIKDVAPARTFGFLSDVENLRARGLAKGGSLDNAVIIGEQGILNVGGLRFKDEFVRHKLLDSIGDLSLIGLPICGHIMLEKSGHAANVNFLKKLLSSVDCYTLVLPEVDYLQHQILKY